MAIPGLIATNSPQPRWVKIKPLKETEIQKFVAVKENWAGASGALKIGEGASEKLVKLSHGSTSGIMGLPLYETAILLRRAGYDV